jgi:hypothetical protein
LSALPISLPNGYALIYGQLTESPSGLVVDNTNFRFGSIYQIYDGGAVFVYGGDVVMYDINDVEARLAYPPSEFLDYSLIQVKLVTKQTPLL